MSTDDGSVGDRIDRLESRLVRLEKAVADLRSLVDRESSVSSETGAVPASQRHDEAGDQASQRPPGAKKQDVPESSEPDTGSGTKTESSPSSPRSAQAAPGQMVRKYTSVLGVRSEDWLSYVGVGLLLFGLAFLFKYSIEQGWLIPEIRVSFGGVTGAVLLAAGLRIYHERRRLRQVLLGGSSATFYGTVFAAYHLYGLVSYPVAFGGMVAVTVGTIAVALRQDHASMAVIGTMGGLGTPFLLYADVGSVASFAAYTTFVLGGACAIYVYRGWRTLLYTAAVGGWLVLLVPGVDAALSDTHPEGAWVLQGAFVLAWVLISGVPILRAVLHRRHPERWGAVTPAGRWSFLGGRPVYGVVTASPFAALVATRLLWVGSDLLWTGVALAGALGYSGAYLVLRRVPLPRYAPAHGLVAAVLATYGLGTALGGPTLLLAWAVEALLLLVLARRFDDRILRLVGHGLFAIVGGWLALRFRSLEPETPPLRSVAALSELAVLGLGVVAVRWVRGRRVRRWYQGLLILGWFGWWTSELLPVAQGAAYLLIVGGGSALGLLWLARRGHGALFGYAAHASFGVLAALMAHRLVSSAAEATPMFGTDPMSEMVLLGCALGASWMVRRQRGRLVYRGGVLVGWLGWWLHKLVPVANGQAYTSVVWGTTAAVLLGTAAWRRWPNGQKAGLATLGLFVGKLFLVDLATLPALWRIALFLGAGTAFLGISYSLPFRNDRADDRPDS